MVEITQSDVRRHLLYAPETGVFIRLVSKWATKIGKPTGTIDSSGHVQIKIDGRLYLAHRLAWLYMYGEWPDLLVDHINGNSKDNRIANLRLATRRQNAHNRHRAQSNNSTGLLGVSFDRTEGKYFAQIIDSGNKKFLGYFKDGGSAHEAYLKEKAMVHEFGEVASSYRPQARAARGDA